MVLIRRISAATAPPTVVSATALHHCPNPRTGHMRFQALCFQFLRAQTMGNTQSSTLAPLFYASSLFASRLDNSQHMQGSLQLAGG